MRNLGFPFRAALAASSLLLIVLSSSSHAQLQQICLALNEGGSGNEYLSVTSKGGLEGNSQYTIEAWVYPTSWSGFPTIVGNDFGASYWLGLNTAGRVRFYPRGGTNVESVSVVPLDTWTHVAAVYNSASGWWIYLNGVLDASGTSITGAPGTSAGDLRIGADRLGGSPAFFWHGYLDEIRIWSSARSLAQIREAMLTGVGRPSAFTSGIYNALQANWRVEYPSSAEITDFGVLPGNSASFVNGDYVTETTLSDPFGAPVAPNVALRLNGINDRVVLPVSENFTRGVTVMAWIAPASIVNFPTIAGRDFNGSFWLGVTSTGRLRFYPKGGVSSFVDGNAVIPIDQWTHVAATYDGTRTILYVNGVVDRISTSITGPVGANGRDVWIGADNEASGLGYPFQGLIDEVKIVQGALSPADVRKEMFFGYPRVPSTFPVHDEGGVSVTLYHVSVDPQEAFTILGSGARIVRGGTAAVGFLMYVAEEHLESFDNAIVGGFHLPDDDVLSLISTSISWPTPLTISQVEVFLSAPLTDLSHTRIALQSPAGTWRNLLAMGDGRGRDLLTVIADDALKTWASGASPYSNGVRPSQPLSGFAGGNAAGTWTIEMTTSGSARVGLWAWGLRFNGIGTDVAATMPGGTDTPLRLAGPNPVASASALAFDLARPARVDLALYDVNGRRVREILMGEQQPGSFVMNVSTEGLPAGVYFASLRVDGEARGVVKLSVMR